MKSLMDFHFLTFGIPPLKYVINFNFNIPFSADNKFPAPPDISDNNNIYR